MTSPERVARRVVVRGRVQGVFFRDSAQREAQSRGVAGWVRNNDDGSVEAHLEGAEADLEAFIGWAHAGSPQARVEDVDVNEAELSELTGFEVRD